MKSATTKFMAMVFVLTAACIVLQWVWNGQVADNMKLHDGRWLLGIFAFTVTAVHLMLLGAKKGDGGAFIRAFMLATTLKFFFYLTVLVAFLLYSKDNRQTLALHFLFYYFAFSALEVSVLYKEIRK